MQNAIIACIDCQLSIKGNYFPLPHMRDCNQGRFFITLSKYMLEYLCKRDTGNQKVFKVFNRRSKGKCIFVAGEI